MVISKKEEENKDKLESCMYHLIENLRKNSNFNQTFYE